MKRRISFLGFMLALVVCLAACSINPPVVTPPATEPVEPTDPIVSVVPGLQIVDKEVIAYNEDGSRRTMDRCFVEYKSNTYYVINNFVVVGQWIVDGTAYSFDDNGIWLKDVILDKVFIRCEDATYYVENNVTVYNQYVIDGAVYNFGGDGKMIVGEHDGYTYGEDGKLVADKVFITINNCTYYIVNNVTVYNRIVIDGCVYDFGDDGKMIVGEHDGYTYGEDGKLVADKVFITVNNATYYIVNNVTVYNQVMIDGSFYYFGDDGKMFIGEHDGYTYGEDGKLVADKVFVTINNCTYYIVNNVTVYNQYVIDGAVYNFGDDGKMIVGEHDGYTYGEDGKLIANEVFITINNVTYYIINNVTVYNQIIIDGYVYDFGDDGKMIVGEHNGYTYGADGKLIADKVFITINKCTYYIVNNVTVYNQYVIDGAVYNFGDDGKMIVGQYGGCTYGADGKLIADKVFITINNCTYYIVNNVTVYNQYVIDGAVYNFGADGKMIVGEHNGYTYGADGKLVANEVFITINNVTYYIVNNVTVYNRIIINGAIYDFGDDGKMVIGQKDGYVYGEDGKLVTDTTTQITVNDKPYIVVNGTVYEAVTLSGTVYESDGDRDDSNNAVISGVTMTFVVEGEEFVAYTDDTGRFVMENVPGADGTLVAAIDGFYPAHMIVLLRDGDYDATFILDRQVSNNLSGNVYIADTDNSISNNTALAGATLILDRISSTNAWAAETESDSSGYYCFTDLTAGMYKLTITKDGYLPIEQIVQVRYNESNVYNIALEAIAVTEDAADGYASGTITDARTGYPVSGLSVYIYRGINNIDGDGLFKTTTNSSGTYSTIQLPAGNYTAYVVDERELESEEYRYGSVTIALKIMPGTSIGNQNATVSNTVGLSADGVRIVLNWGSSPSDLDSHMTFGGNHVYFGNKTIGDVSLDVDDTNAYGPETITISALGDYTYNYYIYNWSNYGTMSAAQATITVYFGNSNVPVYTFRPPVGSGYYWNVFSYNAVTGEFIIHNTVY